MAVNETVRSQDQPEAGHIDGRVIEARERLIVALDLPTIDAARALVDRLGDEVVFYKIGLGLQLAGGDQFARELKKRNKRVFLDYKYHDIEETVRNAVARAADLGVDFLTVHGVSGILRGAVAGRGASPTRLLCVTVLTNMDAVDIQEMGCAASVTVDQLVLRRAKMALDVGIDGVVASALEAAQLKAMSKGGLTVVSPGIRPQGADKGDQKRVATPRSAIEAGADYLVVGRPITGAADPKAAAQAIVVEMAEARPA